MRKFWLPGIFCCFVLIAVLAAGREYIFNLYTDYGKQVRVEGLLYQIVHPWDISNREYSELDPYQYFTKTEENQDILVVIDQQGKLVRNPEIAYKAILTYDYSQLTPEEIQVRTQIEPIVQQIMQLPFDQITISDRYRALTNVLREDAPFFQDTFTQSENRVFLELLLESPAQLFKSYLQDLIITSRSYIQERNEFLQQYGRAVLSYGHYQYLSSNRKAYAYLRSIDYIITQHDIFNIDELPRAGQKVAELNQEMPLEQRVSLLANLPAGVTFTTIQKLFFQVMTTEEMFNQFLEEVEYQLQQVAQQDDLIYQSVLAGISFFPTYGFIEYSPSVPPRVLRSHRNEQPIFFENFRNNLSEKWNYFGSNEPRIVRSRSRHYLSISSNGKQYGGIRSLGLFSGNQGRLNFETKVRVGEGIAAFGFGEHQLEHTADEEYEPMIGFVFNYDQPDTISLILNNEVINNFSYPIDRRNPVTLNLIVSYDEGISFRVEETEIYSSRFRPHHLGSESIVVAATTPDFYWQYVLVTLQEE